LLLNDLCIFVEDCLLKDEESLKQNYVLIIQNSLKDGPFKKLFQFCVNAYQQDPLFIFKSNDFIIIKQELLIEYLDIIKNENWIKPIEIWERITEWVIAQSDGLPLDVKKWTDDNVKTFKTLSQPFISFINFKEISRIDFAQKIKPYKKIFDSEFYVEILEHYLHTY